MGASGGRGGGGERSFEAPLLLNARWCSALSFYLFSALQNKLQGVSEQGSEQCAIVSFPTSSFDVSVRSSPILSAIPFLHSRWRLAFPFLCLKVAALLI